MILTIEEMHWQWRLLYNNINSNHKKDYSDAEIDVFLNRAIEEFVEMVYSGNNIKKYKLGFEVTQQRTDMLRTLTTSVQLTPTNDADPYSFDLSNIDYKHIVRISSFVCDRNFNVAIEQSGDLNTILRSSNRKPSSAWSRAVGRFVGNNLLVYTNNEFDIENIDMDYIRQPAIVSLGTYNDIPTADNPNPGIKARVNCDLPDYHDVILDIAVQEASRVLVDGNALQARDTRITNIV